MRNAALDAENFFDRADRDTPQYQRNQFGGTFGTLGRNTLRGDGFENVDLAFYKNVAIGSARMQFRVELFNAFNHPYFFLPVADLTNANAGAVVRAGDSRQVQLGLKFTY
jgi:hypothetical protein